MVRSWLYVPGNRPDRFDKAASSGADAVIIDLEDAVPERSKDVARETVAEWLRGRTEDDTQIWVRVNTGKRGIEDVWNIKFIMDGENNSWSYSKA